MCSSYARKNRISCRTIPLPDRFALYLRGTLRVSVAHKDLCEVHSQSGVLHVGTSTVTDGLVGDAEREQMREVLMPVRLTRTLRGSDQSSRA